MRETALQLGRQAGHQEIKAWAYEAQAWFAVCDGRYRQAVAFARAGQGFAGRTTPAAVQPAVQEARGDKTAVRDAIRRASAALRRLPRPTRPEHHFVLDPDKLLFYPATCLVRVGDARRGEEYAREVIARSDGRRGSARWLMRLLTAGMDLALALTQLDRPDEAAHVGGLALASDSLVASNLWQANELDAAFIRQYATLPEAQDFHERYLLGAPLHTRNGRVGADLSQSLVVRLSLQDQGRPAGGDGTSGRAGATCAGRSAPT